MGGDRGELLHAANKLNPERSSGNQRQVLKNGFAPFMINFPINLGVRHDPGRPREQMHTVSSWSGLGRTVGCNECPAATAMQAATLKRDLTTGLR